MEPPDTELARAEAAVSDAVDAGARQAAAMELSQAQRHLQAAREAYNRENYLVAKRYAEKARVDAELARAAATNAEASQSLAELEETLDTLEREIGR